MAKLQPKTNIELLDRISERKMKYKKCRGNEVLGRDYFIEKLIWIKSPKYILFFIPSFLPVFEFTVLLEF